MQFCLKRVPLLHGVNGRSLAMWGAVGLWLNGSRALGGSEGLRRGPSRPRLKNSTTETEEAAIAAEPIHGCSTRPRGMNTPAPTPEDNSYTTSVPVPMAMPTSARARAGEFVDPIPHHGHSQAFFLQLLHFRHLM
ncbi:hypothetical protein F7725_009384 [Dissostichus mawsoni]|uniref:Uncharacterized protein n=1 Tax=Dissostichus mawsoni TaxID=36200 RepID=A0A7J5Z6Z6_DISMA|nr:hypothetical protein F7725_009384 [Dissostichus mawsoni]